MIDVHQLKVFLAVAQNLGFTRAAEHLGMTQSAVSHQIARLESAVGASLLVRQPRSVSLTDAGLVMAQHARRVIAALDEAQAAVRQVVKPNQGRLRIGASTSACQYIIPEALREFRECFPDYTLSITPGDTPLVTELLLEGSLDLGVVIKSERQRKLSYEDLFTDELAFLVSPLHPWAQAGRVDRNQMASQRMVLYSRGSTTFQMLERYFARMRVPLHDWIELGEMGAIKELVKLGLGVSVMAEWTARAEIAERSLAMLPMPGGPLKRKWSIATLRGRPKSVAEQTFIGLCRSVTAALGR
ncbi:MAG TPA: LysR family transcriptional regulator [Tepidisphaeraceae bacterium]|nr:LysR family transcriptional regulator [Tepidisphaeraceae bacterium]